ncbi:transcription factor TFIIIB component B'' homolog isoform X4 [Cervus canadensis]|uniref:transcription factor TFIIIB component B'' homolog isoform X4 n=1 Tax=Cervus canadensis TaxID=1574408 RepID=UPI001C9E5C81|nr:transcription factor TFIIIB component B'' homolog isoform X4 [Cervus canadensis]
MFRRARLSVKPNVRPGAGARASTAPSSQREQEVPRPPEPAAASAPKPAESTDVPPVDFGEAEPQEKTPKSCVEKTDDGKDVEESSKPSSTVSQRRKRIPSTSSLVKPSVSVPSEPHPLSTVNREAPQPNPVPAKEKQPCSDRYRIYKAQKLREMLKEELKKEKKQWKNKYAVNETQRPPDRSKMTMRDFIYYLPESNPMTSSLEQEKKTEKSSTPVRTREQEGKTTPDGEDNEEIEEELDDGPLLVPRVKVAEDGSIILDEESLTVEVLRTKGPCVVEENDPIFERGSTTTYSSFRKSYYSKPWSNKETDMFFLAISMVGTDFSMIGQLFPHRARIEIKNKFKREEKTNGWRIDKAFQEKRPFDFDFFAHLLQKVLAEEEKRKQKSVKNQSSKEKKSSKSRKNVKVKKVANDDRDESVSPKISNPGRSQKDAQTVEEELQSLTLSEQNSEQNALELDVNQKKRRRKNQGEGSEQEVHLSGSATVQPGSSKGEKHKNKGLSLSPEINEDEASKEQEFPCVQDTDDLVGLSSSEDAEKRTDPVLSSSQQDVISVTAETAESNTSDLPSSEGGVRALCEVKCAESSCTEERDVDLKSKSLETDQTETVKPMTRGRLQRPKPNLSRAVGKKSVLSRAKTDAEDKSLHKETPVEKNPMEKDGISGMENTEKGNPEPDTVSNLSEKTCLQEDDQPKAFRPARLMWGLLQRPKPNVGKAAERNETLTSQEKPGAGIEKNENESCINRDTPEQIEDQSCENFECEDVASLSGKRDSSFQNVQSDEPKAVNECLSIQEDNRANKDVQIPKTRFQKPKPNIGRRTGRRGISSKEEVPKEVIASEEMTEALSETARLETSLREKEPVESNATKEMESDLKEIERKDISSRDIMPEMSDVAAEMETDLKETEKNDISPREKMPEMIDVTAEMETDLKGTGKNDISPREKMPEMNVVTAEMETDLKGMGKNDISPSEKIPEMSDIIAETETDLKETRREIFPREEITVVTDATEERETDLEETERREMSLQENAPEEVDIGEVETGLKKTEREISPNEEIPEMPDAAEEVETDLEETDRREISTQENASEVKTVGDKMEIDLKETGIEISPGKKVLVGISATGERETDLEETGQRDVFLMEKASGKVAAIEEIEADLTDTGKEISLMKSRSEEIEESLADLENIEKIDISLREKEPEETGTSGRAEADSLQTSSGDDSTVASLSNRDLGREVLSVVHTSVEEKNSEKEVSSQLSHLNISSQSSELDKIEDQRMRPPSVPEQFSDINLSKSLPQEQTPCEVKLTPFVRSRFKRPKPNLARAASKRETTKAEKHAPGKEMEAEKTETVVIQQNCEQTGTLPSQHDVASRMTSGEKDKLDPGPEETAILPCVQTEKDLSPSSSCESKAESQSTQAQEKEFLVSVGTHNINTFEQGIKERVIQTAPLVRGRLQRPRPNLRKAGPRQVIEKSETRETTKEEKTLQKDETGKKFLPVPNSQIATEIEVVSSEVSEGRMSENQSQVLLENLHINKVDVLGEKMRHGHETYVPSPPQMVRRQFQRAKPNLGRAQSKKEASDIEEDRADQRKAKPEDSLSQREDSDSQLLQKGKPEFLTSPEVSARKDSVGSKETGLAKEDAPSELEPSGSVGEKTGGDNSVCAVVEKQCISKPSSPQLLKEPDNSRIVLDRRRALSSASEREIDHSRRRVRRKVKPSIPKGRGSKRSRSKTSKKEPRAPRSVLVTLRASQEEDEDDSEDFESDYEEESYHLAPEEVNKAPVFVPIGLRSPEPVPVQIEETMEELVIPTNVTDVGCITVVEHQLSSNIDVIPQEMRQEENLNALSVEMTVGEDSQADTENTNDGSTEAAIALLTMGDLVLQSEISPEQSDGICILPDAPSVAQSHIPFSPDNANLKSVHECQEPSSPVRSTSPSVEENMTVLDVDKQNTKEEIGLTEEVKESTTSSRTTTFEVTNNLRRRSRFAKPKPNLKKILGTKRFGAHQKVPSLFVTKGEEVEIQRDSEKNASQETELEDKNLGSVTAAENAEQSKVASIHDIEETSISQETHLTERGEEQEGRSEEVPISSVAPAVSSESGPHTLGLGMGLGESSVEEALGKDFNGDPVLTLNVPKCIPTNIPEVQQENVNNLQDLTVNLVNVHQDGEDEQAFILTLVEIPTHAVEEYADSTMQLMPNPLLPAPILVKSVNTKEREDTSSSFPVTSVGQDDMCLSNSERDDSEKSAANLDLVSRKRYHCSLDESDHVPPAKKTSLTSIDDCQKYTSEVCSKELTNVLEETGESYKGQDIFPTSGSIQTISEPQKEQLEPTSQSIRSGSFDKITDTQEKNASQLPQDEIMVSDKEERTCAASESEQMGSITSSSKTPLTRPGRRPLGFLSLICSKNSLDSDEPTQVHSKKRLKPVIPVSRQNLKRSNLPSVSQKKTQESSDVPSRSVVDNTQPTNNDSSATQVSSNRPLPKGECKGGQNRVPEEEPTTVSEYFFNDIFIEVDEPE